LAGFCIEGIAGKKEQQQNGADHLFIGEKFPIMIIKLHENFRS